MDLPPINSLSLRQLDDLTALAAKHATEREVSNDACWRIRLSGKFILTHSGKSAWTSQGRAKSAFINHCRRCYGLKPEVARIALDNPAPSYVDAYQKDWGRWFSDFLVAKGVVEFVQVGA